MNKKRDRIIFLSDNFMSGTLEEMRMSNSEDNMMKISWYRDLDGFLDWGGFFKKIHHETIPENSIKQFLNGNETIHLVLSNQKGDSKFMEKLFGEESDFIKNHDSLRQERDMLKSEVNALKLKVQTLSKETKKQVADALSMSKSRDSFNPLNRRNPFMGGGFGSSLDDDDILED